MVVTQLNANRSQNMLYFGCNKKGNKLQDDQHNITFLSDNVSIIKKSALKM